MILSISRYEFYALWHQMWFGFFLITSFSVHLNSYWHQCSIISPRCENCNRWLILPHMSIWITVSQIWHRTYVFTQGMVHDKQISFADSLYKSVMSLTTLYVSGNTFFSVICHLYLSQYSDVNEQQRIHDMEQNIALLDEPILK